MPRLIGGRVTKPVKPSDAVNNDIPEGLSMDDASALIYGESFATV